MEIVRNDHDRIDPLREPSPSERVAWTLAEIRSEPPTGYHLRVIEEAARAIEAAGGRVIWPGA